MIANLLVLDLCYRKTSPDFCFDGCFQKVPYFACFGFPLWEFLNNNNDVVFVIKLQAKVGGDRNDIWNFASGMKMYTADTVNSSSLFLAQRGFKIIICLNTL